MLEDLLHCNDYKYHTNQIHGIKQCYLPPTQMNVPHLNPSQADLYSNNLPWRYGRLS